MRRREETFAELLRVYHEEKGALCSGVKRDELFSDIPGIAYRNKDKAVIQNDFRPVIDLSTIPFVYDHIEDFENRIIYYESSRGCPFFMQLLPFLYRQMFTFPGDRARKKNFSFYRQESTSGEICGSDV